jgi:hypothetical protein
MSLVKCSGKVTQTKDTGRKIISDLPGNKQMVLGNEIHF